MLLKKYRCPKKGEKWTRKRIKDNMCKLCKHKSDNCGDSGKLRICAKMNFNELLFDGKYDYGYIVV